MSKYQEESVSPVEALLDGKVRENEGLSNCAWIARNISASLRIHLYESGTLAREVLLIGGVAGTLLTGRRILELARFRRIDSLAP